MRMAAGMRFQDPVSPCHAAGDDFRGESTTPPKARLPLPLSELTEPTRSSKLPAAVCPHGRPCFFGGKQFGLDFGLAAGQARRGEERASFRQAAHALEALTTAGPPKQHATGDQTWLTRMCRLATATRSVSPRLLLIPPPVPHARSCQATSTRFLTPCAHAVAVQIPVTIVTGFLVRRGHHLVAQSRAAALRTEPPPDSSENALYNVACSALTGLASPPSSRVRARPLS